MSLQEYLLARLVQDAHAPTLEEVLDRAGGGASGRASLRKAAKAVRSRSRRAVIVVDASVVVTALADDSNDGDQVRDRLRGERLVAPHLIDLEVTSAWRRLAAAGDLDGRRVQLALEDLGSLRLDRVPHGPLIARCWELRENLTVYDAAYVALAEIVEGVLVTADARLASASGRRCEVELIARVILATKCQLTARACRCGRLRGCLHRIGPFEPVLGRGMKLVTDQRANCGSRSGARFSTEVGCRERAYSDGSVPRNGRKVSDGASR
jgi:predicted nucleic acid-binding protein